MQPSYSDLRAGVDPLVTEVARGYLANNAPAANVLFPAVPVDTHGGRIISFGPDAFQVYDTRRAPGADTQAIQLGYAGAPYALVDRRLMAKVPVEHEREAAHVGIDVTKRAVDVVMQVMSLEREVLAGELATDASQYESDNKKTTWNTSGRKKWDDWENSNPFADIAAAKESIRGQIGVRPNVLVAAPKVLTGLASHPLVLARLTDTKDKVPATNEQLARLFGVDRVVEAGAIRLAADGATLQDVWGLDAVLAYTNPASLADGGSPSFGYTYNLRGYPFAEPGGYDISKRSMLYPINHAYQPVIAGKSAGYLFQGAATGS